MKKAAGFAWAALMLALEPAAGNVAAAADCGAAVADLRARLVAAKVESARQEVVRLLEKAEKDDRSGRSRACEDAVRRALTLVK
jgi:Skp family chaperone for outer membrane proteins